jgi:hypothetical protein
MEFARDKIIIEKSPRLRVKACAHLPESSDRADFPKITIADIHATAYSKIRPDFPFLSDRDGHLMMVF